VSREVNPDKLKRRRCKETKKRADNEVAATDKAAIAG